MNSTRKRFPWYTLVGALAGAAGLSLWIRRERLRRKRDLYRRLASLEPSVILDVLACPVCHEELTLQGAFPDGLLACSKCQAEYPLKHGIPHFADYATLGGMNRRFAGLYDWFSYIYRIFAIVGFRFIGTTEDTARRQILSHLKPHGKVLEVSIGPGNNLPYLMEYPGVTEIHGLDISNGQLDRCQQYLARREWPVFLYQGNAEQLPFRDTSFDSVFHVGGINFFNDKKKAIAELVRVAKPGAKIIICDESERGARGYEITLPGFKQSFDQQRETVKPPIDLVPADMQDVSLDESLWNGWFYCLEFRKPDMVSFHPSPSVSGT